MNNRLNRLMEVLHENELNGYFINSKENVFYFTNLYAEAHERLIALYVDTNGNAALIVPALEKEDAKNAGWDQDIIAYFDDEDPFEKLNQWLTGKNLLPTSIAIEETSLNVARSAKLKEILPNVNLVNGENHLNQLRVIKSKVEIEILKEAAAFADFGIETAVKHISPGKTELEIIAEVEYALKQKGIRNMSFSTLVLTGEKTASPHGNPSLTEIKHGDFVLMDLGVVHKGYCSDITRTVAVGEVSTHQKEVYETVLEAENTALKQCEIGMPLGDIDRTARDIITDAGYGEYFTHRIGHGLGINVHEFPSMAANNTDQLKAGMTFTIEPGIYMPGVGGVRIEDDVLMTEDGAIPLTKYPKELQII
ncbi:M24 family metallopeptidase [Halalkalibacillus halophilus]|uniref:M24 family metallopeptidase n=1 Tax=Halalkalibacillus halophilus TaxID=392827 RepID=UPI0003F80BB5|nr:Xaa-Pro peptidase family protein [Halalkalibacillus halophilus]